MMPIIWIDYRKLRNQLTHEYPNNEDEIVDGIKIAIKSFEEIEIIFDNIQKRTKKYFKTNG